MDVVCVLLCCLLSHQALDDITLDDPAAPVLFRGFIARAIADGVLDRTFTL